jgi:tRNA nucleotidyltransferase/poly(A) polymerase
MKVDTPEFKALFSPELTTLATLFKDYGYELRIAGGAVRLGVMNSCAFKYGEGFLYVMQKHNCDLLS